MTLRDGSDDSELSNIQMRLESLETQVGGVDEKLTKLALVLLCLHIPLTLNKLSLVLMDLNPLPCAVIPNPSGS